MAGIFDYLSWRGDLSFAQAPFNPVDNIILTHLPYLPLDGIVPGPEEKTGPCIAEAAEQFAAAFESRPCDFRDTLIFKDDPRFLKTLARCERYRGLKLRAYVNQIDPDREKQFAALTIITGDGFPFISYRGTDGTLVGWKEDFNMSFSDVVPAQTEAAAYLEKIAGQHRGPLRIGGHSKGGNLAVYASAFCAKKIQRRIRAVYSNDAPGFTQAVIQSPGYQAVREKIHAFVPQDSVIGMLFEHEEDYTVVKSARSGLTQHDIYFWEVNHNDVIRLNELTRESRFVDRTLKEWIGGLDRERREQFIETLYNILKSTEVKSFPELGAGWLKNSLVMLQSLTSLDESARQLMAETLAALFKAAKNNINALKPAPKKPSSAQFPGRAEDSHD